MEPEVVSVAHRADAVLGEGPVWIASESALLWVDIAQHMIHKLDMHTGAVCSTDVGEEVGAAAPRADGSLLAAVTHGFAVVSGGATNVVEIVEKDAGVRMNDGKCDPAGRFWAGSMDRDGVRPSGSLYRVDPDLRVTKMLEGLTISNGMAWVEGRMFLIDSATYRVDAFDYDFNTGAISDRRTAFTLPEHWGLPDGMTVDRDGGLWIAFWGGSCVRRLSQSGTLEGVLELPASQVTAPVFGGAGMDTLFVTSARWGKTAADLAAEPLAGSIFAADVGVAGWESVYFGSQAVPEPSEKVSMEHHEKGRGR